MRKRKHRTAVRIIFLFSVIALLAAATAFFISNTVDNGNSPKEIAGIIEISTEETTEAVKDLDASEPYLEANFSSSKTDSYRDDRAESGADENPALAKAEELLSGMDLYEKVCQMFVVTPEQLTGAGQVTAAGETTKKCLSEIPVGGVIYLKPNIKDPVQTKEMLSNIQKYAMEIEGIPLFLCIDEEGGRVSRIGENAAFKVEKIPPMGDITSAEGAFNAGSAIGKTLSEIGFNTDFAPVCDVLTNSGNSIIGDRSFGSDAERVNEFARSFSDGLHEYGILSTYKHFPGHGATAADTHKGFAYTDKELEALLKEELVPFAAAGEAGADMVMVSHISVPNILGDNTPCSISPYMVTEILRERLGFNGIIITDAMNMGAITKEYDGNEAVALAIKAGNDLILSPVNLSKAIGNVVDKVRNGEISEDMINDAVKRIILKKLRM